MKHRTIIACLCERLEEGQGINTALAEINLTADWLKFLTPRDRVKLHQARNIFLEGLEHILTERARLGRDIGRISHALRMAREAGPLRLLGDEVVVAAEIVDYRDEELQDDEDEEVEAFTSYLDDEEDDEAEEDDTYEDDEEDDEVEEAEDVSRTALEGELLPPSPPPSGRVISSTRPPAPEKAAKPTCTDLRGQERPLKAASTPLLPPEAPPEPKIRVRRTYSGNLKVLDEAGKVIRTVKANVDSPAAVAEYMELAARAEN